MGNRFRQPAEWDRHRATWLACPHLEDEWGRYFEEAQEEWIGLCRAIADPDPKTGASRGERLEILVTEKTEPAIRPKFKGLEARFHQIPYGDSWTRDIAPIFVRDENRNVLGQCFRFNGWGNKYIMLGDSQAANGICKQAGIQSTHFDWILEGGAVDVDGEGTCLTTRSCLLNPNRNSGWTEKDAERHLNEALGIERVLWLEKGLENDHTDGHIDTLARFVSPGVVVCMEPRETTDPNANALNEIIQDLKPLRDAHARRIEIVTVPSPGKIADDAGTLMPASYCNFYIANTTVIVPTYGSRWDTEAVERIGKLFPTRKTIGLPSKTLLTGGGAFHCVTQQQP